MTGEFSAYVTRPKTSPASAVVVLQELFGVNADIRKHCDELAEQGYLAVAPDLYWRQEPGIDLNVTSEADCRGTINLLKQEPSAQSPWQNTMLGLVGVGFILFSLWFHPFLFR